MKLHDDKRIEFDNCNFIAIIEKYCADFGEFVDERDNFSRIWR